MFPISLFDESVMPKAAVDAFNIAVVIIVCAVLPLLIWVAYGLNRKYEKELSESAKPEPAEKTEAIEELSAKEAAGEVEKE